MVLRRCLLPLLTVALVVPNGTALAQEPGGEVRVAAVVERGDGRLSVVHTAASSPAEAQALVRRWRGRSDVRAAAVSQPVRALGTADPLRSKQWGLTRLKAETTWSSGRAGGELVAVLDTGVAAAHPDLAGVVASGLDLVTPGGTAGQDPNGHGTHVAGVIAATADNGTGGAGFAQGARILPVRVLDAQGQGYDSAVAEGVLWAVDHGATVVNLSLGGPSPSPVLTSAVRYALDQGVVVVAAAGNEGAEGDPVLYPAATPGVLAVGAVDSTDARPAWSSSGAHLSLAAPGVGVVSTVPAGYASMSGTSMAAPFASAAVALLQAGEPSLTPAQVVARLTSTAQDLGTPGRDPQHGAGMVDVLAARAAAAVTAPAAAPAPAPAPVTSPTPAPVAEPVAPAPTAPPATTPPPTSAPPTTAPPTTAPPTAAPAPVAAAPLTVRTSRSAAAVTFGQPVVLGARVLTDGRPVAGRALVLQRRVGAGAWTVVRRGVTDATGLARWALRPDRTGLHRFVVGTAVSGTLRVDVRQAVSSSVARTGGAVVATATVRPQAHAAVALQALRSTGWTTVATARTDATGRVRLTGSVARGTAVRLSVAASPALLPAVTASVRP